MKPHIHPHIQETELARYVARDLAPVRRTAVWLHVRGCDRCLQRIQAYRADQAQIREASGRMPEGVEWDRLASEITANIRVGLAAGECVAPRSRKLVVWGWRPAAVMAGMVVLLAGAWWLNTPPAGTQALGRAVSAVWNGSNSGARHRLSEDRGPVVAATASGIELRENGSSLGVSQGTARPLAVSVNVQGSASARYVDADTGQMTITSVYVQ
jgi:hypothetical protein